MEHGIKQLRRDTTLPIDESQVELGGSATFNRDAVMPIGRHPILKIPKTNAWSLVPGENDKVSRQVASVMTEGSPAFEVGATDHVALCCDERDEHWNNPGVFADALIQIWNTYGRSELYDKQSGTANWREWSETIYRLVRCGLPILDLFG